MTRAAEPRNRVGNTKTQSLRPLGGALTGRCWCLGERAMRLEKQQASAKGRDC